MKPTDREKVIRTIDHLQEEILDFARNLVRIPSIVGDEGQAQEFILGKFKNMGLETKLVIANKEALQKHPEYCEVPWDFTDRPNVIGKWRGKTSKKSLILNGHIDVVTPGPSHLWRYDPWGAEVNDGKLYGRGALDMKAGVTSMIYAVQSIQTAGIELEGDIILESVIEEESGGSGGTLTTLLHGIHADAAIIPEPTSLNLGIASLGVNYFRVSIMGEAIHPQETKKRGVDALKKAFLIWSALDELGRRRREKVHHHLFEGETTYSVNLTTGVFKSGDWPSTIPGWAEMECRVSFTPEEEMETIKREVERTVFEASNRDPWLKNHPPQINWFGWNAHPSIMPASHPLLQTVARIAKDKFGIDPQIKGCLGGGDSRLFIQYGIPAFYFGPRGSGVHETDEFVFIEDIFKVAKILALTILEHLSD